MSAVVSDHVEELDATIAAYPELLLLDQKLDPESNLIRFADGNDVYVRAKATLIGSWGRSESWRWAWPNESLPPAARNASLRLKELAQLTGRTEFLNENAFPATAIEARRLVADACHYLGAAGVRNVDSESAVWWIARHNIEHLRPLDAWVERAAETAAQVLVQGLSVKILNALKARNSRVRISPTRNCPVPSSQTSTCLT